MTNAELLAKIKAEIERLEHENCMNGGEHFCMRRAICLGSLRNIITPLYHEQPEVDLESFVKTYFKVKRLDEMKLTTSGDVLLNFAKQVSRIAASAAFANCELTPENTVSQNIDQEIENTIKLNDLWDLLPNTLIKYTANHFYGLRNRALEEAARRVYESWMGGTMDDVRRDMVELGKVLNARKED